MDLRDRVVFVTGASSGIGEELCCQIAAAGAKLILFARRADRLAELKKKLDSQTEVIVAVGDVTHPEQLASAVALANDAFGHLDIVVANAGFGVVGNFEQLSVIDYRRQFETNVFGVLNTAYATLNSLKKSRGQLVLLGSVSGFISLPGNSPYGMSKHAVRSLAASLYYELKPYGVAVTHVAPGFVDSEIRKVDNQGNLHSEVSDSVFAGLRVKTPVAVRQMIRGITKRRREVVVTGHGKALVFFSFYFNWLLPLLISRLRVKGRSQPTRQ